MNKTTTNMLNTELNLLTWNATGIMPCISYLRNLLNQHKVHICGISEHWLFEKDLKFLETVSPDYMSYGVSDSDLRLPLFRKVGKGGVALLWHRDIDDLINIIDVQDDRIVGLHISGLKDGDLYVFQVYLPSRNHPIAEFTDYVDKLWNIVHQYNSCGTVLIMGDFNCRFDQQSRDSREASAVELTSENDLQVVTLTDRCTGSAHSFVSYDDIHCSLIDHVLAAAMLQSRISRCKILDDHPLNVSRHRPIIFGLRVNLSTYCTQPDFTRTGLNWKKLTKEDIINSYTESLSSTLLLDDVFNREIVNEADIDAFCGVLCSTMVSVAQETIPHKHFKPHLKPYWSEELKHLHTQMRRARAVWLAMGRPRGRDHESYSNYKDMKRQFRCSQRRHIEEQESRTSQEADSLAEVDQAAFWRLVNSRKKQRSTDKGANMQFGDSVPCKNGKETAAGWGRYFGNLYSPLSNDEFDDDHYNEVLSSSINENVDTSPVPEITRACASLKRGKAAGIDSVSNEHLIYGGPELIHYLCKAFNSFLRVQYVPTSLKRGMIVTLFKGGKKKRTDPNSYRAITLLSSVYKLFERVLLSRLSKYFTPSPLQHGFQKGIDSTMTSVLLHECVHFCHERSSKLFACFLDAEKAFDCVWHAGLFFKLRQLNIPEQYQKTIESMYYQMESCVLYRGFLSDWFHIQQGTRQGGVLSPWLYTVFVNGLLNNLSESSCGLNIHGIPCSAPTQADDITLLSVTKNGLDALMNICYGYSRRWRFNYSAKKSAVLVFNETDLARERSKRSWFLGTIAVSEVTVYTHLGVNITKSLSTTQRVTDICRKLKSTFFSSTNLGIHEGGFHPITSATIYKSIVLQRALYGSETLQSLTAQQSLTLERSHRFCLKLMQNLPVRSRTDVVLSLIGILPLVAAINTRKLSLFGRFMNCSYNCTAKNVVLVRFFRYQMLHGYSDRGFTPEISKLTTMYNLQLQFSGAAQSGAFPRLPVWKRMVKESVMDQETASLRDRMSADPELQLFQCLHNNYSPHILWRLGRERPSLQSVYNSILRVIARPISDDTCQFCEKLFQCLPHHLLNVCNNAEVIDCREKMWLDILDHCSVDTYVILDNMSPEQLSCALLDFQLDVKNLPVILGHFFSRLGF